MDSREEEDELLSLHSDSDQDDETSLNELKNYKVAREANCSSTLEQTQVKNGVRKNDDNSSNPSTLLSVEDNSESDSEESQSSLATGGVSNAENGRNGLLNGEVLLSDDDEDNDNDARNATRESMVSGTSNSTDGPDSGNASRYGLRRKRKINYAEIDNGHDLGDKDDGKHKSKKEAFDIFSLPVQKIIKLTQKPELIDNHTCCKIFFMDGVDSEKINLVTKFFEKCGRQFEAMFIHIRYDEENFSFLKRIFKSTSALGKLIYRYHNREDAIKILKLLKKLRERNHLPSFESLKLVGVSGEESLTEEHLTVLSDLKIHFRSLELGDALWEDVKSSTLEKILEQQKSSLESLIIHGGFRGDTDRERKVVTFPKMETLETLCVCPNYTFLSEIKNPYSKKARIIKLDMNRDEPFKIAIKFSTEIPTLKRIVFGNLIDIEDLLFSSLRKLTEFRCGSYWNLSIRFPAEGSRKSLMESNVTQFQFPDAMKDPLFTVKVAKHFPHLKKVWMFLPSVPVLRAFFKAFEESNLEELYLKTQFDFESTMESCLLPRMSDILRKSPETESLVQTLKEYKHFNEYVRYYNMELPVEAEDLMEGHSAGIRSLRKLKVLHLEHIPRTLLIPNPDDERKWYDHNCKFMSTTFGYERYPLNYECHREILQLDLSEYIWKHIQIESKFTEDFYQAGFVDISNDRVSQDIGVCGSYSNTGREEEDIFVPVQRASSSGAKLKIMPSMLFADVKIKPEGC